MVGVTPLSPLFHTPWPHYNSTSYGPDKMVQKCMYEFIDICVLCVSVQIKFTNFMLQSLYNLY